MNNYTEALETYHNLDSKRAKALIKNGNKATGEKGTVIWGNSIGGNGPI